MYPIQWDIGGYVTRAEFAKDVQQAYKDAIKAFYDAGVVIYNLMMCIELTL